ncbi:glycosyltransferase family 4 protein [Dictyobacter aurantiacus]|uniref:Glycosyl transferase n=1 Tax=Dictyobacter aurantiacus TaxID=1936993 RepID=A0A401ZJ72_9CHLR|nr:glycosyltransferase family 4 protein [Dictyobacter aurantiacus]GCE06905.1 glycosyl transferase [Dictyobacter aurantiacus]
MKIAHIAPPWITIPPKNYGGTENVIYNIVEEQVAQGHDVTLFAPGDARTSAKLVSFFPHSLIDAGVPWQAHLKAFYHTYKSIEYIKEHHFDIVHSHLSSSADMYAFPLTQQLGTPHVSTLHSRFPFDRVQDWTGDADQYFLEWMRQVPIIAISENARAEVKLPLNFVGVVHHGLPMQQFKPTVRQPENFVVWLGRFVPEKGAHHAIKLAKAAGLPLVLAGTIDRHVQTSIHYYEEVIKPQLNGHDIKYIGPVNTREKIDLLSRARVFLNPIEWEEPFGMVMIEAMSVGCPVISFARGAAPEVVAHGKSGYLVNNLKEMRRALDQVDLLDRAVVRKHVEDNFSARVMVEKYVRIYQHIRTAQVMKSASLKRPVVDTLVSCVPQVKTTSPLLPPVEPVATPNYSLSLLPQQSREIDSEMLQ